MEGNGHHIINRIGVIGGFLDGLDITLSAALNCFIGPRGSGKTTTTELARYALDEMPGRKGDPLRDRIDSVIESNLGGGRVELGLITKDGQHLTVTRSAGGAPLVFDSTGRSLPGLRVRGGILFQADILSQNQIEAIAEQPHYQLDLIDKFRREELSDLFWKIDETQKALKANAAALVPLIDRRDTLETETQELPVLQAKLAGLREAEGSTGASLNQAYTEKAMRDKESRVLDEVDRMVGERVRDIEEMLGSLANCVTSLFTPDVLEGPNGEELRRMEALLRETAEEFDRHLGSALHVLQDGLAASRVNRTLLEEAHRQQEMAFRQMVEQHRESLAKTGERTHLEKRCNDLAFKQREIGDVTRRIDTLTTARTKLLQKYSQLHQQRFDIRKAIAADLSAQLAPSIRVRLEHAKDPTAYRIVLEGLLRKSAMKNNIVAGRIAATTAPDQLVKLLRAGIAENVAAQCKISPRQAEIVMGTLNRPETLFELETLRFEDAPYIELFDRGTFREASALSTGQRCTTILPILLLDSSAPLIIDQPEDNLDNSYIYEVVVTTLRKAKINRQLIFMTHNPNIPVLGEAELIVVMQAEGAHGQIVSQGTVDERRGEIVTLLEGGEEAFMERQRRYGFGHDV